MMKFDAGIGGTFSGAPGSEARPAETSHDSGLIPEGCFSILSNTSSSERQRAGNPPRLFMELTVTFIFSSDQIRRLSASFGPLVR
jgi:hypothetical protein